MDQINTLNENIFAKDGGYNKLMFSKESHKNIVENSIPKVSSTTPIIKHKKEGDMMVKVLNTFPTNANVVGYKRIKVNSRTMSALERKSQESNIENNVESNIEQIETLPPVRKLKSNSNIKNINTTNEINVEQMQENNTPENIQTEIEDVFNGAYNVNNHEYSHLNPQSKPEENSGFSNASSYENTGNPIFDNIEPVSTNQVQVVEEKSPEPKEQTQDEKLNDLINKLTIESITKKEEPNDVYNNIEENKNNRYSVIDDIKREREENRKLRADIDQTTNVYKALDEQITQIENDIDLIAKQAQEKEKAEKEKNEKELQQAKEEAERRQNQIRDLENLRRNLLETISDTELVQENPVISSGKTR